MQNKRIVEFKIEYTERDAPPLDELLAQMSPDLQRKAEKEGLINVRPAEKK